MKYLLKLIHEECGGNKAVVDSIWSEIQSEVEEVEEVEEEVVETHLDKHISPPPTHYVGKKWSFTPFNSVINPNNCHIRRSKRGGDREQIFHQCTRKATEKHGYCQGCIDLSIERDSKHPPHTKHRIGIDGDIRIWGGLPEDHGRSIRDNAHGNWLVHCVCQGRVLHYQKDIPEEIITKFNLPRV